MKKDQLLKVYRNLWSEFATICRAAGASAKPSDGSSIQIDDGASNSKELAIRSLCYFPDWRYKSGSLKERIRILVQSKEIYLRADDRIKKSNIQVLYMRSSDIDAPALLALHYDYEAPAQTAHPVFHAQLGMGNFPLGQLKALGFRGVIKAPPRETLYSSVRIPTPCMNFPSVLLGLAADHLEARVFDRILSLVRSSDLVHWDAVCQELQTSLGSGNFLPSHHWYETVISRSLP